MAVLDLVESLKAVTMQVKVLKSRQTGTSEGNQLVTTHVHFCQERRQGADIASDYVPGQVQLLQAGECSLNRGEACQTVAGHVQLG